MRKTSTRRRAAVALAVLTAGVAIGAAPAAAAKIVRTAGGPEYEPNQRISDTTRWSPGPLIVRPNERVIWIDRDETPDPHTITIVSRREVPRTLGQLSQCRACALSNAHLADPSNPESDIARTRVNRGRPGLDARGDSLLLPPGGRIGAVISAPIGRTLHYICGIHPWMIGSITVSRTGGGTGAALTGRP